MRGNAERVLIARRRAAVLARRLERRTLGALGTACLALLAALISAFSALAGAGSAACGGMGGAMLLYEDAGGYVLVGVAAFTAAVLITVACIRIKRRSPGAEKKEDNNE